MTRTIFLLFIGTGLSVLLVGCKNAGEAYRIDPILKYANLSQTDESSGPIDLDRYCFPEDDPEGPTAYQKATCSSIFRNRLRDILVMRSDEMYEHHKSDALAFAASADGSMDLAQTIVAGIGALTLGKGTSNILSGTAAMIGATKQIYNNAAYQKLFIPAIIKKTDEVRNEILETLYQHDVDNIKVYSVDRMIGEVNKYHFCGSFYRGVIDLASPDDAHPSH